MTERPARAWLRSLPAALVTVLFAVIFGMVAATAVSVFLDNPRTVEETPVALSPGLLRLMLGAGSAVLLASVIFRSLRSLTWGVLGRALGLPRPTQQPQPDERIYSD